jgi:hypothetical protein
MFSGIFKPITIFFMFSKCFLSVEHQQYLQKYISIKEKKKPTEIYFFVFNIFKQNIVLIMFSRLVLNKITKISPTI